ncbi:heterokaryon incompatibility protein-domain-containing protein [Nemania diffusa]|nr:heterokaryon incompatibility protein-domain-containing protein [Nemania diffusa]
MSWSLFQRRHQDFEYASLRSKPRAFRVIKLLPPSKVVFPFLRETVNIEIMETNVDEAAGDYDTLSYCWGDGIADRVVTVSLSGHDENTPEYRTICISASLESALLSLARQDDAKTSRPIFADQICINQADNAEKIQQVQLMGEIYSGSARTITWLGEGTTETRRYLEFLSELSSEGVLSRVMGPNVATSTNVFNAVMKSSIKLETESEREDRDDMLDLLARYGPRFPLRGLSEILRRAWHNRVWTVQEGCLPANMAFRCGDRSVCYDCFRGGLFFHSIYTTHWVAVPQGPVSKEEIHARNDIYKLSPPFLRLVSARKAIHGTDARRTSLYDAVVQYNVNNDRPKIGATKAEDRIYALLGLAGKDEIARETVEEMEVDNVRSTFTKFAASVVKRKVDVLLFSQWPKSLAHGHQLPSWVPDWSADPLRIPHGYSDVKTPVFSAGGHQDEKDVVADVSAGVLRVNAIPVGRVIRVGVRGVEYDEAAILQDLEFKSAKHFFNEIDEFLEEGAKVNPAHAPDISNQERRLDATIRLADGGLSARQFPAQFDPTTATPLLREIHNNVSQWGKKLIEVEARTRSLSTFTGMIRSAGVMPWYWTPASEIDVARLCAIDPVSAVGTWIKGFFLSVYDVGWVVWYMAKVRLITTLIRVRRKREKVDLHDPKRDTVLKDVGLLSNILSTPQWDLYTSNIFKTFGRRLLLTDTGYVGLGPCHMEVGDAIVVIPGGSVPYILRSRAISRSSDHGSTSRGALSWEYIGEAYCDGIMDGEIVSRESKATRQFEIM